MKIFVDSSTTKACYVVAKRKPKVVKYPARVTTNEGEYLAVVLALEMAWRKGYESVEIISDSQLIIRQLLSRLNPDYKPFYHTKRGRLKQLGTLALSYARLFDKIKFSWVPRKENLAGIYLEKVK